MRRKEGAHGRDEGVSLIILRYSHDWGGRGRGWGVDFSISAKHTIVMVNYFERKDIFLTQHGQTHSIFWRGSVPV